MRRIALVLCLITTRAAAQQVVDTARPESARAESTPPTLEQLRYLDGLRKAGRGIAQLKDGVNRVANAGRDSTRLRLAGRRLGGLCAASRGFMTGGRARMQATAYQDSTQLKARRLAIQIDSLVRSAAQCEGTAGRQPDSTATVLIQRLRAYELVLRDFRAAIGLPNR